MMLRKGPNLKDLVVFGAPMTGAAARSSAATWLVAAGVAIALAILAATTAVAMGGLNRAVMLNRQAGGTVGVGPERPVSGPPTSTSFSSIPEAEARAGFRSVRIESLSGTTVTAVVYRSALMGTNGKQIGSAAIEIDYTINGKAVQLVTNAPTGGRGPYAPSVKNSSEVTQVVETHAGNQYVVVRDNGTGRALLVGWQTTDGRTVYMNNVSAGGLDTLTFDSIVGHLQQP